MGDFMRKIWLSVLSIFIISNAFALNNTNGREPVGDKCYFKNVGDNAGAGKANYILYFDFDSAVIPNGDCLNRLKADLKTIDIGACQTLDFDGFADGVGTIDYNLKLSRNRIDFAKNLIKGLFPNSDVGALYNSGNIAMNAAMEAKNPKPDSENRKVEISIITKASCGINQNIGNGNKTIDDAYAKVKGIMANFKASVWRDSEGEFNKARLLSDSIAGVVLGTAGGLITSNVIKKNQVESGFEDIKCSVGGQVVANWGDEFTVGSNLIDTEETTTTTK